MGGSGRQRADRGAYSPTRAANAMGGSRHLFGPIGSIPAPTYRGHDWEDQPGSVCGDPFEERREEGKRLARTGAGDANHIAACA